MNEFVTTNEQRALLEQLRAAADGMQMVKLRDDVPCIYPRNCVIGQIDYDLAGRKITFVGVNTVVFGEVFYFIVTEEWTIPKFLYQSGPVTVQGSREAFERDMLHVKLFVD